MLLLAANDADYARQLADRVMAAAAPHLDHSPWLAMLLPDPAAAPTPAALVAGHFLLPHMETAAAEGRQRQQRAQEEESRRAGELAGRVATILLELRQAAAPGFFSGEPERQALQAAIGNFSQLSAEVRGLGLGTDEPAVRAVARAEPIVWRLQERADAWEHAARIDAVWRNQHLFQGLAALAFFLLLTAPAWLPALLALPMLAIGWRTWSVARIRAAIRGLAEALPLRVTSRPSGN